MRYTVANTMEAGKPVNAYVNGNKIDNVIIADTDKGEVVFCPDPVRSKRGTDEVYTRKLRGNVTVEPI